jgi:hypothetical protein
VSYCASGPGEPKPGSASAYAIDPQYLCSILPPLYSWICPFLPYIPPIQILDLGSYCAIDPPSLPTPDGSALSLILAGSRIGVALTAIQEVSQIVHAYLWNDICQCPSPDTTPADPSPLSPPLDLPALNPGGLVALPTAAPCGSTTEGSHLWHSGDANVFNYAGVNPAVLRATSVRILITASGGVSQTYHLYQNDHSGTQLRDDPFSNGPTGIQDFSLPLVDGCEEVQLAMTIGGSGGSSTITRGLELYCGGSVGAAPASTCCPPDPNLMGMLTQILSRVTELEDHFLPSDYGLNAGSVIHVTGDGHFSVSGLLTLQVFCTAHSTNIQGELHGDPVTYYNVGWIRFLYASGFSQRHVLDQLENSFWPPYSRLVTAVYYHLEPGITASLSAMAEVPSTPPS